MLKKELRHLTRKELHDIIKDFSRFYKLSVREISKMVGLGKSRIHQILNMK